MPQILNELALTVRMWIEEACTRVRSGWVLLTLVAISQITMPVTQHLWTWDHFLHGGTDFETGAFLVLITFCLVVVLARACKAVIDRMLAALRTLEPNRADSALYPISLVALPGAPADAADLYNLALRI